MKILISIIIAIVVFFTVGFSLDGFTNLRGDDILAAASIAGVISLFISFYKIKTQKTGTEITADAIGAIKEVKENIQLNIESKESEYLAIAEQEYEKGDIDKSLWSQALVKAKGNESLRKLEYMKLRARKLRKAKN